MEKIKEQAKIVKKTYEKYINNEITQFVIVVNEMEKLIEMIEKWEKDKNGKDK